MRTLVSAPLLFTLVALSNTALADRIAVQGVTHEDVYVRSSATMYYVQVPATGAVWSVPKAEVAPENVHLSADAERAALLAQWNTARASSRQAPSHILSTEGAAELKSEPPLLTNVGDDPPASHEERTANANLTRQHRVAPQAPHSDGLETRVYAISPVTETLPKIVAQAPNAALAGGGGFGAGSGVTTGGGFGANQGAALGAGAGFPGAAGGAAAAGGGGFGGGNFGATHFSNISQLFTTIDDRLVGEAPNLIVRYYGRP